MTPKKKQPAFEEMMDQFEEMVKQLEAGGQPLEETIRLYEQATGLEKLLQEQLKDAKQRLTQVQLKNGEAVEIPAEVGQ